MSTYRPNRDRDRDRDGGSRRDRDYNGYHPPSRRDGRDGGGDNRSYDRGSGAPSSNGESYRPRQDRDRDFPPRNDYDSRERDPSRYDAHGPSDVYRPNAEPRPPRGDFTFRMDKPPGIPDFPSSPYPPPPPPSLSRRERDGPRDRRAQRGGARGRGSRPNARGGRGGFQRERPSDRALLQGQRSNLEEEVLNAENCMDYKDIDELSDDEEAEMDISDRSEVASDEHQSKRVRRAEGHSEMENSAPKWSNPDPYSILPPTDDTSRKKRDVVKLIRKARVDEPGAKSAANTTAEDFISFDLDENDDEDDDDDAGGVHIATLTVTQNSTLRPFTTGSAPSTSASTNPPLPPLPPGVPPPLPPPPDTLPPRPLGPPPPIESDLGSRKRTTDGQIKPPNYGRLKKTNKSAPDGRIKGEWCRDPSGVERPTPWLTVDHSATPKMGVWLHKEIMDFYEYVRPRKWEHRMRTELVEDLKRATRSLFRDAEIFPFGSFKSGIYLPTADMDFVVCSNDFLHRGLAKYGNKKALYKFKGMLERNRLADSSTIELIIGARVPLVKYIDIRTGLRIDVSFERYDGVRAIDTFVRWKAQYPSMPILVTLIKHFLVMRGLNEPVNGGIGGFSVICLVVSMLQLMPQVQSRDLVPEHHLGEILMEFFWLYGEHLDYENVAISLNPPRYIPKRNVKTVTYKNAHRLSIIDPNDNSNDISGSASNFHVIRSDFAEAHKALTARMRICGAENKHASLLEPILGGNYKSFRLQRKHLRLLHEKHIGPCEEDGRDATCAEDWGWGPS